MYVLDFSYRILSLWNEFLTQTEKEIENTCSLVKQKLLSSYNELSHF